MKKLICIASGISVGLLLIAVVFAAPAVMKSDDLVKVSPNNYKVLLDNERVRMLEYHLRPGEKEETHTHHRPTVVYFLKGGTYEDIPKDGAVRTVSVKAGEVGTRQAEYTHSMKNTGKTEISSVVFEVKDAPVK